MFDDLRSEKICCICFLRFGFAICHFREGAKWEEPKARISPRTFVYFVSSIPCTAMPSPFPPAISSRAASHSAPNQLTHLFSRNWVFFLLKILSYTLFPIYYKHVPSSWTLRDFELNCQLWVWLNEVDYILAVVYSIFLRGVVYYISTGSKIWL